MLTNLFEYVTISNNRKRVRNKMFEITEKSIALREIRKNDYRLYGKICRILAEPDIEMTDAVPLEYAHNIANEGMSPEEETILSELKSKVTYVLSSLAAREERVLRMRFGIGLKTDHTLEEVAKTYSVNRERIRQIEAKSLRKLKHHSRSGKLRSFLN